MRRFYPPTVSDLPLDRWSPYTDVHRERIRAHEKHDENGDSMERKSWDQFDIWLSVIGEEVGEVSRVLCEHRHAGTYGSYPSMAPELREELIQVAAMALAWVDAIDEERCGMRPSGGPLDDYCCRTLGHAGDHLPWSGYKYQSPWVTDVEWRSGGSEDPDA